MAALALLAAVASSQEVAEVYVTPETMILAVGQGRAAFPAAFDQRGNFISGTSFAFRSSDSTVARVGDDGMVVGVRPGLARVEVAVGGHQASVVVEVTAELAGQRGGRVPAPSLTGQESGLASTSGSRVALLPGQQMMLKAGSRDTLGLRSRPGPTVRWRSSDPEVARVRSDGVVTAIDFGHAMVTATAPAGRVDTTHVFVIGDLLVSSDRAGNNDIYQINTLMPDRLVPLLVDSGTSLQASYSPDRTRIAFTSNEGGAYAIRVMDADGGNVRWLTAAAASDGEPAWTPDGSRIVFSSVRSGISQLYVMRADGTNVRPLSESTSGDASPAVSPDGRTVAFVSSRDGKYDVYLMDIDGGNRRRLTATPGREANPRFFPNGDLAFITRPARGDAGEIVRMSLPDRRARPLVTAEYPILSFDLSRDGTRVAYVIGRTTDPVKARVDRELFVQSIAPLGDPVRIPLQPGEQVRHPDF